MAILKATNISKLYVFLNDHTYKKKEEVSAINFFKLQANLLTEAWKYTSSVVIPLQHVE